MEEDGQKLFVPKAFAKAAKHFFEQYTISDFILPGDVRFAKKNLKTKQLRSCLFCGKSMPQVSFATLAHLVPQLIGNLNLYSDFECDACNQLYSKYENDLANFIGLSRSITGLHGEKKATGFMAKKLHAKSRTFVGNNILIIAPEDIKRDGPRLNISYTKNSYVPQYVYKALLKCALSLLGPHISHSKYKLLIHLLEGKFSPKKGAIINGYTFPFRVNLPLHIYIFEKKNSTTKIATHIISFYFQNRTISITLPLHTSDLAFLKEQHEEFVPPPFFLNKQLSLNSQPIFYAKDMASSQAMFDDVEVIEIEYDKESFANSVSYDPVTDEYLHKQPPEQGSIKHLIIIKDGVDVDPKMLSAFIKNNLGE